MKITVSGRVTAKSHLEAHELMIKTLNKQRYHVVDNVSLRSHTRFICGCNNEIQYADWDYEVDVVSV